MYQNSLGLIFFLLALSIGYVSVTGILRDSLRPAPTERPANRGQEEKGGRRKSYPQIVFPQSPQIRCAGRADARPEIARSSSRDATSPLQVKPQRLS